MTVQTITYDPAHDLQLDLYLPDAAEAPPLLIYMHGGGLESGSRSGNRPLFERLAAAGVAAASLDYRMYPSAGFPDFIDDCAGAIAFLLQRSGYAFSGIYAGGSSAGAYLSMMLLFDRSRLGAYGIDPLAFDGWVLDAGQPTVHFNILRERGMDTRLVRIDEAAPLYYIQTDFHPVRADGKLPSLLVLAASDDIPCRLEQLELLCVTLRHFGWQRDRLRFCRMDGYAHCAYDGEPVFPQMILDMIAGAD